eukprot:260220_1
MALFVTSPRQSVQNRHLRQYYASAIALFQKHEAFYRGETHQRSEGKLGKPDLIETNNQHIESLFGELFREILTNPSLLSPICYNPPYQSMGPICALLTRSLLRNPFDDIQQHALLAIVQDVLQFEFDQTPDSSVFLRQCTVGTGMLHCILKQEHISTFINGIVRDACDYVFERDPRENLEIDSTAPVHLCEQRRQVLMEHVDVILEHIMIPDRYPYGLRVICWKLKQLELSKSLPVHSLLQGFIFLRIFCPKIAYYGKKKSMESQYNAYGSNIRRKFVMLCHICWLGEPFRLLRTTYMQPLQAYIMSKQPALSSFFDELANINVPLTNCLSFDEYFFISVKDLEFLIKMIAEDYKRNKPTIVATNNRYYSLLQAILIQQNQMFEHIPRIEGVEPHVMICVKNKQTDDQARGGNGLQKQLNAMCSYQTRLEMYIQRYCYQFALKGKLKVLKQALEDCPFIDLNAPDANNKTLMDYAIDGSHIDMVALLSKCGATRYLPSTLERKTKNEVKQLEKAMKNGCKILNKVQRVYVGAVLNAVPLFDEYLCRLVVSFNSNVCMLRTMGQYNNVSFFSKINFVNNIMR